MPLQTRADEWGRIFVEPKDVFELIYSGTLPENIITDTTHPDIVAYNALCTEWGKDDEFIRSHDLPEHSPEDEQQARTTNWHIPEQYEDLDIRALALTLCETDVERDRVNLEMDMYEARNLLPLLRLMYSLVDSFRKRDVVWGIGRGSSVASFVLFLLGVHKIDSIKYDLDINEFLR